jgi:hypothetical protein
MRNNHQRESGMASSATKPKSAMDELLDSFGEVIDSGAKKMEPSELRDSEKRFNQIADRAAASRKPRRESA